jgi:aryl carrier-like protein
LFSELNQPFAPADPRSAAEIIQRGDYALHEDVPEIDRGVPSLRRMLLKEWRQTEGVKR